MLLNKIKTWSLIVLFCTTVLFGYLLFKKKGTETLTVTIPIEVPVPGKASTFPPVELPKPKKVKPRPTLVEEFRQATDSVKDSLYADAVKERLYEEIFTDSTQSITVKSNVQGKLLKQEVGYEIFPDTLRTEVTTDIKVPVKPELFFHVEAGANPFNPSDLNPALKGSIFLQTKKKQRYSIGLDTDERLWLGVSIKF